MITRKYEDIVTEDQYHRYKYALKTFRDVNKTDTNPTVIRTTETWIKELEDCISAWEKK